MPNKKRKKSGLNIIPQGKRNPLTRAILKKENQTQNQTQNQTKTRQQQQISGRVARGKVIRAPADKTAGDIVREARIESARTGQDQMAVIRALSLESVRAQRKLRQSQGGGGRSLPIGDPIRNYGDPPESSGGTISSTQAGSQAGSQAESQSFINSLLNPIEKTQDFVSQDGFGDKSIGEILKGGKLGALSNRSATPLEKLKASSRITPISVGGSSALLGKAAAGVLNKKLIVEEGWQKIPINTVIAEKTKRWMIGLVASAKAHPGATTLAVGASVVGIAKSIIEIIGTYNFAGFLGEETSQTAGFASSMAINNMINESDFDFIERSLAYEREILEPRIWSGIINATPQKRVADQIESFQKAAMLSWEEKVDRFEKKKRKLLEASEPSEPSFEEQTKTREIKKIKEKDENEKRYIEALENSGQRQRR